MTVGGHLHCMWQDPYSCGTTAFPPFEPATLTSKPYLHLLSSAFLFPTTSGKSEIYIPSFSSFVTRFTKINMGGWEVLKELMPLFMLISIASLHYEVFQHSFLSQENGPSDQFTDMEVEKASGGAEESCGCSTPNGSVN